MAAPRSGRVELALDENAWRHAVAAEETLTVPQMKFQRRKLLEKGELAEAEVLQEQIRGFELDSGEYTVSADSQEAWDVANGVPLSRSARGREAQAMHGPHGESISQMEFDMKRLRREGKVEEAVKLAGCVDEISKRETARRVNEERRAMQELEWEFAAVKGATAKKTASPGAALHNGVPLKSFEKTQLEFELKKFAKGNNKKEAAPFIAELERRGAGVESKQYFWDN